MQKAFKIGFVILVVSVLLIYLKIDILNYVGGLLFWIGALIIAAGWYGVICPYCLYPLSVEKSPRILINTETDIKLIRHENRHLRPTSMHYEIYTYQTKNHCTKCQKSFVQTDKEKRLVGAERA
jgi:hypothetical protein